MAKRHWLVRIHKVGGEVDVATEVVAESAHEALLKAARKAKVWPKGAGAHMQHFPGGHTWHVWPTWKVGNATSLGDMYVARIIPAEEA